MYKKSPYFLSLLCVLLLANCAKNISSSEYSEAEVGAVKQTYRGIILNVRPVKVQGGDSLQDNTLGLMGGGVGGAVVGSQFGKGKGQVVGTLLGAAAGALGGAFLEKKLKEQDGIEYTVELSSGRIMTIVQGPEPRLQPGQAVLVMVGDKGRSRVVADQTGGVSYAQRQQQPNNQQAYNAPQPSGYNNIPQSSAYNNAPQGYAAQQQPQFDDIDEGHRDVYARDAGERASGTKIIVR